VRRTLILAALAAFAVPSAAAAQTQILMPGVTFSREVQFTPHGPVVLDVLTSPRPTGLWGLHPVLANGLIQGAKPLTAIQKAVSTDATVAGTNGDITNPKDGHPSGMVLQSGVLESPPFATRSSLGVDALGNIRVQRVGLFGTWKGTGQRRPLNGFNQKPGPNGISLYTPAWGPATPPLAGDYEVVLTPFPAAQPNANLSGVVVGNGHDGNTAIPVNGAVLVARGVTAQKLAAEAAQGVAVVVRLGLKPEWSDIVDAIGGGPVLVSGGKPVFRADEAFTQQQLLPRTARTAVGQTASGQIVQIVTDGDQPGYSVGMTNFELAQALVGLGAVTGYALDSGGASSAAFDGQLLSRPSNAGGGELPVKECLCVFYYGVYAPPPTAAVLSPNGDGVDETQTLAYKVVRPSTVTVKLIGPDKGVRISQTGPRTPGVYTLAWNGETDAGDPELEGLWRWTVTATDDLGRASAITRTFWLNDTLGFLRGPARVNVRVNGKAPVVATFQLTHPARVIVRIETPTGVVLRTLTQQAAAPGPLAVAWDGLTDNGVPVYSGSYAVHVTTVNAYGSASLTKPLTVHRIVPLPPPKKKPKPPAKRSG
jgi:hypothetical protein